MAKSLERADEPAGARTAPGAQLTPHDFDRALRRMKAELAATELRRHLLDPNLEARAVLEIADRVLALQAQR